MLLVRLRNVCLVLASRGLFVGHGMITVYKAATYLDNQYFWMFMFFPALITFEAMAVIVQNHKIGVAWICTSAMIYITGTCPPLWLLELQRLDLQVEEITRQESLLTTTTPAPTNASDISKFTGIEFHSESSWTQALEQIFILILILGRWIMPKGNMSRSALSQLLFIYLAIASDIMGLFVLFYEKNVVVAKPMHYIILTAWSLSLYQMAITVTTKPKAVQQFIFDPDNPEELVPAPMEEQQQGCCDHPEVFSLLTAFLLMDGPFLIIRLWVVFGLSTINYNILFFIAKNMIMILLALYRLVIVFNIIKIERKRIAEENQKLADNMDALFDPALRSQAAFSNADFKFDKTE